MGNRWNKDRIKVLIDFYRRGYEFDDIAALMGVPVPTVV